MTARTVRAAGAVLWRPAASDGDGLAGVEVALIRRNRYGDWSLPKGKLEDGEDELTAAVREVTEETGAAVTVGRRLPRVSYQLTTGPKTVAYWAMRQDGGAFTANPEVDALEWLPVAEARPRLTYHVDRRVLDAFTAMQVPDSTVLLVRHAKAGKRSQWHGDDQDRPLEPAGRRQARALARMLGLFGPQRVMAAGLVRCRQTVEPLANALGVPVEDAPAFADAVYARNPHATEVELRALGLPGPTCVVCSQGETIPGVIRAVADVPSAQTQKAGFWVLSFNGGRVVAADYYRRPTR